MTEQERKVLEMIRALDSCDHTRIVAAYAACFPGEELTGLGIDTEGAHSIADGALCTLVHPEIVAAFNKLEKWYS